MRLIYSSSDEVIGATSFSVDITDELRANEELKTFAKRQETLMKELEHRVKNSLTMTSTAAIRFQVYA